METIFDPNFHFNTETKYNMKDKTEIQKSSSKAES